MGKRDGRQGYTASYAISSVWCSHGSAIAATIRIVDCAERGASKAACGLSSSQHTQREGGATASSLREK